MKSGTDSDIQSKYIMFHSWKQVLFYLLQIIFNETVNVRPRLDRRTFSLSYLLNLCAVDYHNIIIQ